MCRLRNPKEIGDCQEGGGKSDRQHKMIVCMMTVVERWIKWWKLEEDCCEDLRERPRQAQGGCKKLPDNWVTKLQGDR